MFKAVEYLVLLGERLSISSKSIATDLQRLTRSRRRCLGGPAGCASLPSRLQLKSTPAIRPMALVKVPARSRADHGGKCRRKGSSSRTSDGAGEFAEMISDREFRG